MAGSYDVSVNSTTNSTTQNVECDQLPVPNTLFTVIGIITLFFGTPACVAVLWYLFQKLRSGVPAATPNDVYMLNLTVMDLVLVALVPVVIFIYWSKIPLDIFSGPYMSILHTGRPLFMTCICLDCFLAVVHPITYRARKGLTPRVLMSIAVWVITLVYGALHVVFDDIMLTHPVSMLPCILTISTIGICDFFILRALKSSDPGGRDLHPQKKKALQIIVNSLVMTVISYLPPLLVFFLMKYIPTSIELKCLLSLLSDTFAIAGSAVLPVLYLNNLGQLECIWLSCQKTT